MASNIARQLIASVVSSSIPAAVPEFTMGFWGAIVAVLFVVALPGVAIGALLLPRRGIGAVERLALSLGIGLGAVAVGGLILDRMTWGLTLWSWVVFLTGVIILGAVGSIYQGLWVAIRRYRFRMNFNGLGLSRLANHWLKLLWIGVAISILIVAIYLGWQGAATQVYPGYSQLWALRNQSPDSDTVTFGVHCEEKETTVYTLAVDTLEGLPMIWDSVALNPGETWEVQAAIPRCTQGCEGKQPVLAKLYKEQDLNNVYRIVWLRR